MGDRPSPRVGSSSPANARSEGALSEYTPADVSTVVNQPHPHPTVIMPQGSPENKEECNPNPEIEQARFALVTFNEECKCACPPDLTATTSKSKIEPNADGNGDDADTCCNKEIMFGEPEKQFFKNLGQELLSVGRQLLTEFNPGGQNQGENPCCSNSKVEPPSCVIGSPKFEVPVCPKGSPSLSRSSMSDNCRSTSFTLKQSEKCIQQDLERNKCEFIEAFSRICDTIASVKNHQPQSQSNKCAQKQTSSGEGLMEALSIDAKQTSQDTATTKQPAEIITELEKKTEELTSRLELMDSKLSELDTYTATIMETVLKHNSSTTSNLQGVEGDVLRLAKLIRELQCVTKVQMHFGQIGGGADQEGCSDIPKHLIPQGKSSDKTEPVLTQPTATRSSMKSSTAPPAVPFEKDQEQS